jgi:transcription elongation factor GreB
LRDAAASAIHRAVPPSYITPEGLRRLQEEADRLWRIERPRVTREVSEAAALGDRSENAEYIYGKRRLREIDRRLRFLQKRIDELTVVRAAPEQREKVFFGAWVVVEEEGGERRELRIVGPDESDPAQGLLSMESPLGRALLGKRVGDEVLVRRPKGELRCEVLAIRYEP